VQGAAASTDGAGLGGVYRRREPETTALYRVLQQHLATFEQQWTDPAEGRTLPRFVIDELRGFLDCGILARGFAHLYCDGCGERHLVAFACKGRGFCPACLGRRMTEGAANLVDHVLPRVPLRQWVLTLPYPLRFPLAFDAALLGAVLRLFLDTVAGWYRQRQADRGLAGGQCGAVTVIQRGSSDLRLNPHFHAVFLDGVYLAGADGAAPLFHPAPAPTQEDVEAVVERARRRILRLLVRRGIVTVIAAPGEGELDVRTDDGGIERDPLLAHLLAASAAGAPPAGPANKRAPVRLGVDPAARPERRGRLVAQDCGFNLHAATRVASNDDAGREALCRYILRPPIANAHLHRLPDGTVQITLKRPWSDGTTSIALAPLALIARLAALVPPPRRHVTRYFGVLAAHSKLRPLVVPRPPPVPLPVADDERGPADRSPRYIPWAELLRRTFAIDLRCQRCGAQLRLIALVKTEGTIKKILASMGLPTEPPPPHPARPPPTAQSLAHQQQHLPYCRHRTDGVPFPPESLVPGPRS